MSDLTRLLPLTSPWVVCFALLLGRTGGWVVMVPLLGAKGIAAFVRAAVAATLAFALTPVALAHHPQLPCGVLPFIAALLGEVVVGAFVGWLTGLLFSAAEMAGSIADMTAGLSFASMVDPASGGSGSTFSRLFSLTFMAVAFAADAHHTLIEALASTLRVVPPGVWPAFHHGTFTVVVESVTVLMRAAIEIGAPLLGALFLTEVALGLVSKFYPQANVTIIGINVKALVAMATAGLALMLLPQRIGPLLEMGSQALGRVL